MCVRVCVCVCVCVSVCVCLCVCVCTNTHVTRTAAQNAVQAINPDVKNQMISKIEKKRWKKMTWIEKAQFLKVIVKIHNSNRKKSVCSRCVCVCTHTHTHTHCPCDRQTVSVCLWVLCVCVYGYCVCLSLWVDEVC